MKKLDTAAGKATKSAVAMGTVKAQTKGSADVNFDGSLGQTRDPIHMDRN